jgi:hypothetical protein
MQFITRHLCSGEDDIFKDSLGEPNPYLTPSLPFAYRSLQIH